MALDQSHNRSNTVVPGVTAIAAATAGFQSPVNIVTDCVLGFGGGQWKVKKSNLVTAKGIKKGTLDMVDVHVDGVNDVTPGPSPCDLWHQTDF
ncbi:hypothetical protein E3N88_28796 [Mikania micrantha]|uniref:Uncharacterized protein n=1 Tax=Mikania micrantha TaxID=192012 RepID=A0A5N6N3A3_9ASTR|nr:hypothetical protein E3N88_28796 [Mikania micrantha]